MSRRQLLEMGFGPRAVGRMLQAARLHPVHRGVYAVGHRVLGPRGRWMAAVLACGDGATLSHRSAAEAWDIWPRFTNDRAPTSQSPIHVTVPGDGGRDKPGIAAHRSRLAPADVVSLDGVRTTSPSRTLIDLAAIARTDRFLERALDETSYRGLLDLDDLRAAMRRARHGTARLRRVPAAHPAGTTRTATRLEEMFLRTMRLAGLPQPLCNQRISRMTVDFLWPHHRLVAETDGGPFHDTSERRRTDRRRDAALRRRGYRVVRFSDDDVLHHADAVLAVLRPLLLGI